jgi:putative ABC transport system substrate-binding protein
VIEYRWAEARTERFAKIAAEFVKLKVDVIVTYASAPVLAAKHTTTLIPIVFAAQMDPVGAGDPLVFTNRIRINTLAQDLGLPTIYGSREYVEAGALMSYGPNFPDLFQRAAEYVDKILRGTKPADIPVEQPTKFDLVINLKTAKAIGLKIPESFLMRADEVIE